MYKKGKGKRGTFCKRVFSLLHYLTIIFFAFVGYILFNAIKLKPIPVEKLTQKYFPNETTLINKIDKSKFAIFEKESSVRKFCETIRFKTDDRENDPIPFQNLWNFTQKNYPNFYDLFFKSMGYSQVFRWVGKNENKPPILFTGHVDVVKANENEWKLGPFSGKIFDGKIYGRGTVDDKITVFTIISAVEELLKEKFQPERTVWFSFGEDEELGGNKGAKEVSLFFEKNNIIFDFMIDEASCIVKKPIPGIGAGAFVGITEKEFYFVNISISCDGGHSSMPERGSCVDLISKVVSKLLDNPMKPNLSSPIMKKIIESLFARGNFLLRVLFGNHGIFGFLIDKIFSENGGSNALIRTTFAPTVISSGSFDEIDTIPTYASTIMVIGLLPDDEKEVVQDHIGKIVKSVSNNLKIEFFHKNMYKSNVSKHRACVNCKQFELIRQTINSVYENVDTTPYILVSASDLGKTGEMVIISCLLCLKMKN